MSQHRPNKQINTELAEKLNQHVSLEAASAFQYFSMASWAEIRGLTGIAAWCRSEANGEMQHMLQFVDHLNDRGYQATFGSLESPRNEWDTVQALFEDVVGMEHQLCDRIESLIESSHSQRDHFTGSFLQSFVPQQIADTAEAEEILDRLKIVGKDGQGVILIDQELRAKVGR